MFDEAVVEMDSGAIVRLPELSARLAVGEKGPVRPESVTEAHKLSAGSMLRTFFRPRHQECKP